MQKTAVHSFHTGSSPMSRTTSVRVSKQARRQATRMADVVTAAGAIPVQVQSGEETADVPPELVAIFRMVIGAASAGETITLLIGKEDLSSQEAADMLNVSRPHVIKLARVGVLPFHKVGNRHRFSVADIVAYQRSEEARRDRILAEMAHKESFTPEDF
jgi:excisionase family DNA binding protein